MTTSSKLRLNNKSRLSVPWICLLPLIPSIILFSFIAYQLDLASMSKLSTGSHLTCHYVGSWSLSTQLHLLSLLSVRVSSKDQSSVLFHSFSTQLLLILSYLTQPSVIMCMQMTVKFSFLLSPLNTPPKFHTCKPLLFLSLGRCLPIFCH